MFTSGASVKIHGAIWTILSIHNKGKTLKVAKADKVTFKKASEAVAA